MALCLATDVGMLRALLVASEARASFCLTMRADPTASWTAGGHYRGGGAFG